MLKALCFLLLVTIACAFNTSALPPLAQIGVCIETCVLNTGHSVCGSQFTFDDASLQCACTNPTFNSTVQQCVITNQCPQTSIDLTNKAYTQLCQNATTTATSSIMASAQPTQSSSPPAAASVDAAAASSKEFPFSGSAVAVFVVLTVGTLFF
ncbi:unnamed protein product [Umbelopsis ramanniana]